MNGLSRRWAVHVPGGHPAHEDLLSAVRRFHDVALSWHGHRRVAARANDGAAERALDVHALNFDLWHHEDAVRRHGASDREIATTKRSIDDLNARRNAAIEDIDVTLLECFGPNADHSAPVHTETPGMIVDRLSVLTLRMVHTKNAARVANPRLVVLNEQHRDLIGGLANLLARVERGEASFKVYRQFKSADERGGCYPFETPTGD